MTDLAEVARAVAEALGLEESRSREKAWRNPGTSSPVFWQDGSNLTAHYWFFECCEWLHEQSYILCFDPDGEHGCWNGETQFNVVCSFSEAPARLVAAVWRKMNER